MNAALGGVRLGDIEHPYETVMLFDAIGGWNLAGGKELVVQRHASTANFAFADGHVQYRHRIGDLRWKAR